MVTAVSRGQALQVAARVATQVKWDKLDAKFLQIVLGSTAKEFGDKFTAFLSDKTVWNTLPRFLEWKQAYQHLGMEKEYATSLTETLSQPKPGYWNIPVLADVTPNKVAETLRRLGVDIRLYINNLDATVTNDRDPENGSYTVFCKVSVEADEENKNLSANMLDERGIKGLTLLERLLLELAYWLTTGNHLDIQNTTLCSGSRYSVGLVPSVHWDSDNRKVFVSWDHPGGRDGHLRARTARQ